MEKRQNKKIIVIFGPTSSGKSELAVKLAKKFNGEIISADSRQVYRGMDIGTGKVFLEKKNRKYPYIYKGIPHYLIDVASPKRTFTLSQYKKLAEEAINKIIEQGKVPILCGGTGLYFQAIIDGMIIPKVKPNWQLRKKLERKNAEELFKQLEKIDPKRAEKIDRKNKRRLIRALEIINQTKKTIPALKKQPLKYPVLALGIKKEKEILKKLINKRLLARLNQGKMIKEVENLRKQGISWKKLEGFGLEYRFVSRYLQNKITYGQMVQQIQKESENYAKRQMTWFTRQNFVQKKNIQRKTVWIKNYQEAKVEVINFL
jgi:tRNA dimethylallyltransferase